MTDNQTVGLPIDHAVVAEAAGRRLAWLEASVLVDPLTGLGNRRAAVQAFDAALASSQRHDAPVAVALVDIDGLKAINDAQGHAAGDAALVAFADALRQSMRADDTAFRFGGDEFVVLAPGATADELAQLFERVRIAAPAFTVGIAQAPADGMTQGELVAVADQRMYASRRSVMAGATAVPARGRGRRLATVGALLAVLTLGVPVLAWARHLDRPDDRATGAPTTTVTTMVPTTTSTSVAIEAVVARIVAPAIVAPRTAPSATVPVTRRSAARPAPAPTTTAPTPTPTTGMVQSDFEAATADDVDKRGKKPKGNGRGGGRGKP